MKMLCRGIASYTFMWKQKSKSVFKANCNHLQSGVDLF